MFRDSRSFPFRSLLCIYFLLYMRQIAPCCSQIFSPIFYSIIITTSQIMCRSPVISSTLDHLTGIGQPTFVSTDMQTLCCMMTIWNDIDLEVGLYCELNLILFDWSNSLLRLRSNFSWNEHFNHLAEAYCLIEDV